MEKLTPSQALSRMKHYCAYQERCHAEVKDKLFSYGLDRAAIDNILSTLISQDYLNEQRFAIQFAGGKFRMKRWGKEKIAAELKSRHVSEFCIQKALSHIDGDEYASTFYKLAERKKSALKSEKNIFVRKRKMRDFLRSKGYGNDIIYPYLAEAL